MVKLEHLGLDIDDNNSNNKNENANNTSCEDEAWNKMDDENYCNDRCWWFCW